MASRDTVPSRRARLTIGLSIGIIFCLYADQNLLAPNLTVIGEEFRFTRAEIDQRLGADINLVFWMVGGVVTLVIGYVADRTDWGHVLSRTRLLVAVALLGHGATLMSGLSLTFEQLFWSRALTGIGIGGAYPLTFSLLADYFPPRRRVAAVASVGLTMGLGIAAGQTAAGVLAPDLGWRFPFLVLAAIGAAITLCFALLAKDGTRGRHEPALQGLFEGGHVYTARIRIRDLLSILRVRTNQLVLLQGILASVPWSVFFIYLNDYYAHDKGFPVPQATTLVMMIGVAVVGGGFAGGLLGQAAFNRQPHYLPLLCAVTTLVGVAPTALLIGYPISRDTGLLGPGAVGAVAGFLVAIADPNLNAILIHVNPPERRAAVFSVYNLCKDLGRGWGAWIVGGLAVAFGRVWAFHAANLLWMFCGLTLLVASRSFARDAAQLQRLLAAQAARARHDADSGALAPPSRSSRSRNR